MVVIRKKYDTDLHYPLVRNRWIIEHMTGKENQRCNYGGWPKAQQVAIYQGQAGQIFGWLLNICVSSYNLQVIPINRTLYELLKTNVLFQIFEMWIYLPIVFINNLNSRSKIFHWILRWWPTYNRMAMPKNSNSLYAMMASECKQCWETRFRSGYSISWNLFI